MATGRARAVLLICIVIGLNMHTSMAVTHGRNLIWAQTDEQLSGISRIVSIDGDPDRWVPNKTASTRYITAPSRNWHFAGLSYDYRKQNLYWSDTGNKKIQGFLLNGTNSPFTIFDGISSGVLSLTLDWLTGNIYWADSLYNWIVMAPATPDTRLFRVLVNTDLDQPMGLVVHPFKGLIFWSDWGAVAKIERADTRGGSRRIIVQEGLRAPMGLTLDMAEDRLYWVDRDRGTIESTTISGDLRITHFVVEDTQFVAIALYHDYLFVTDQQDRLLYAFNRKSGTHEVNFSMGPAKPSSVIMYDGEPQRVPSTNIICDVMSCDHMCVSTYGGLPECICASGYDLQADGKSCVDDGKYPTPMFVYSIGNALCRFPGNLPDMKLDDISLDTQCFLTNRKSVLALGANVRENTLYFAENVTKTISKVKLAQGESPEIIVGGTGVVEGLAVDWITSNVYWSDSLLRQILVAKSDGRYQIVLHEEGLEVPRGVAVDAIHRALYWTDAGSRGRIERSGLDGSGRWVFVDHLGTPNHLDVDYQSQRLFWTDSADSRIMSVDLQGGDSRVSFDERGAAYFSITHFQDFLIWTETGRRSSLHAGLKDTGAKVRGIDIIHPGPGATTAVLAFDLSLQPLDTSPCDTFPRCQQLCLPGNTSQARTCACAMGFKKHQDGTACVTEPLYDDFLLFTDTFRKQIYQLDVQSGDFNAVSLSGHDNPIAVDYDPRDRKLYWTDVSAKVLKRALLNGSEEEILRLLPSDSVPDGIAIDSVSRLVYYTDAGTKVIALMTLTSNYHVTLISDGLDQPRAIALDPIRGHMYWTDWSTSSRIEAAHMDGSQRRVIVDTGEGGWPNGLTIDTQAERLYWCDARTETIETVDFDGGRRRVLFEDERAHFFGITILEGVIYYTDWEKKSIMRLKKVGLSSNYSLTTFGPSTFPRANDIHAYKHKSESVGRNLNACTLRNGRCSHVCIPLPGGRKCACPDGVEIGKNMRTCISHSSNHAIVDVTTTAISLPNQGKNSSSIVNPQEKEELVLSTTRPDNFTSTTLSSTPLPYTMNSSLSSSSTVSFSRNTIESSSVTFPSSSTSTEFDDSQNETSTRITHNLSTLPPTTASTSLDIQVNTKGGTLSLNMSLSSTLPTKSTSFQVTDVPYVDPSTSRPTSKDSKTKHVPNKPKFPPFNPRRTTEHPSDDSVSTSENPSRKNMTHSMSNSTGSLNASDIVILDSHLSYIALSGILGGGVLVMLVIIAVAVILFKKLGPKKSSSRADDVPPATSSHVPNFHATYEMPLTDAITSSHPSAERLAGLEDSFFSGHEDPQGVENPSFVRKDNSSSNTIYEEIPGFVGSTESPTFTTFIKDDNYLTDDFNINRHYNNNTLHTTVAHVHAHSNALDHGNDNNYHVIHSSRDDDAGSSTHRKSSKRDSGSIGPPVPDKNKLLDVYATISRAKHSNVGRIASLMEQENLFHRTERH